MATTTPKATLKAAADAVPAVPAPEVAAAVHAPGVTPDAAESAAKVDLAAADSNPPTPDAEERAAKVDLASPVGDPAAARDRLDRARRARALVAERNVSDPARVGAIDTELAELGFPTPLPTTAAQRGEPVGRTEPGARQSRT